MHLLQYTVFATLELVSTRQSLVERVKTRRALGHEVGRDVRMLRVVTAPLPQFLFGRFLERVWDVQLGASLQEVGGGAFASAVKLICQFGGEIQLLETR